MIIRFAGDSGDGMQLTGDRFTSETALLGNDLATFPDFPAEIRAPAGSLPGVSGLPGPLRRPRHPHRRRPAERARRDEPGRAEDEHRATCRRAATLIVNTDAFNERNLQKAGYAANPLEDGSLDDYHVHEVPLTSMTVEALKGIEGITPREAERSKNLFALGLMSWLYHRPTEGTIDFIDAEVREAAGDRRGEHARLPGRLRTTARRPRTSRSRTRSRRRRSRRAPTARSPATPALALRADRRVEALGPAALPRRLPDHAGVGDPRGARAAQGLRRPHVPGRGRDRRRRRGARRRVRRRARRHDLGRARASSSRRRRSGLAVTLELPLADPRHPARRPVDRDADEARAGRPADGALRAQRREPGAGGRRVDARRSASTPRSRRRGSRSSTGRPSTCSRTPTSRTAPSRG